MTKLVRWSAALVPALLAPVAAAAAAALPVTTINVLRDGGSQLAAVKRQTGVAVLLPARLPLGGPVQKLYATGSGDRKGWILGFDAAPGCGGADACFVASFEGRRGGRLPGRPTLHLADGAPGLYRSVRCGGSCAPATLWFVRGGTLYTWQVKEPPPRSALVRAARAALAAGPR